MEIVCPNCKKRYRIDESKLPEKEKVYIKCAGCYEKIEIDPAANKKDSIQDPATQSKPSKPVEYFEPGTKAALIYCEDVQARLEMERNINKMGFEVRIINDKNDARHQFRYNIFDIVLIYQKGPDPEANLLEVLDYFNHLAPEIRREVVVVYIHLGGNRYNFLEAFSKGVDITLNPMDLNNMQEMLTSLIEEKRGRYKIFTECLRKVEESIF